MKYLPLSFLVFASGCIRVSEAAPMPASAPQAAPAQRGAQTPPAAEGHITGRVVWHGAHPATAPYTVPPTMAACGTSVPFFALAIGADEGVANAIVTIQGGTHPPVTAGTATLDQRGCVFSPHVLAVTAGSRVSFANHDTVLHSVHGFRDSTSDFNLATPPNLTMGRAMSAPGLVRVQCDTGHTWMSAFIDVVETPWYAVTDAHGHFSIDHVPPGTYTLQMWHEGWTSHPSPDGRPAFGAAVTRTASVTVPASPGPATHDFSLP